MLSLREFFESYLSYPSIEIVKWHEDEGLVDLPSRDLPDVLRYCLAMRPRPILLTHVVNDERSLGRGFCLYLVLYLPEMKFSLTLLTKGIKEGFPSLTPMFPALNWSEREAQDLFGLKAHSHPDPRPLVLHPGWPKGFFPLRKDYQVCKECKKFDQKPLIMPKMQGDGIFEVSVGPIHAGIIEPGHFRFYTVGEVVHHIEAQLFFTHKGIEKLLEGKNIDEGLQIVERVCGVCSVSHALAYCEAVEKLASVELSRRVLLWRTILAELERCYNHIGDIGNLCAGVGFALGNANGLQCKEKLQQLNSDYFGHRFLRGNVVPGGIKSKPTIEDSHTILRKIHDIARDFEDWVAIILEHDGFRQRAVTTGVLNTDSALDLGVTGPTARASAVANDWRELHPHLLYSELGVKAVIEHGGDVWSRLEVKVKETRNSFRYLETLLVEETSQTEQVVENQVLLSSCKLKPWEPAWGCIESPRGMEVIWLMLDKDSKIYRCRIRSASYANWPAVPLAVMGNIVPDFPLINKSFELCYSCCDR